MSSLFKKKNKKMQIEKKKNRTTKGMTKNIYLKRERNGKKKRNA